MKQRLLILGLSLLLASCSGGGKILLSDAEVFESSAAGLTVGTLSMEKPKDDVVYTYSLLEDANGAFDIQGPHLIVANGSKIDFEDAEELEVTVQSTGDDDSKSEETFVIAVKDIQLEVTNLNNNGSGSLRKLIADADSGDVIGFDASLKGTIELNSRIDITKKITIVGPGSSVVALDAQTLDQIFYVDAGGNLTVSGLTFQRGDEAIIVVPNAKTNVSYSVFKNNSGGYGGAIDSAGTLTIDHCYFTQNEAFNGGAIGVNGPTVISNTLIYGNATTGNSGGGIVMSSGDLTLINTTLSGNNVTGANRVGGAIACVLDTDTPVIHMYNVTITDNNADVVNGIGGGIYSDSCELTIQNSIIAGNSSTDGGEDIYSDGATTITGKYNLIGSNADNSFVDGNGSNQVGTSGSPLDPKLAALAFNDALIKTHALKSGSPALDQIPEASCKDQDGEKLTMDQRGFLRPVGSKCDIGAFEAQ